MNRAIYYSILLLYNILVLPAGLLLSPIIALLVLTRKKYRGRILQRLGFLKNHIEGGKQNSIWVHTLSIGETTSALPLLRRLREAYPEADIVLSVTTSSGQKLAREQAAACTDFIIPAPLDLMPTILLYLHRIKPDLFILVETDFWPNWLTLMRWKQVPSFLVNGRISDSSIRKYKRLSFLFTPLFNNFSALCMQTERDCEKMRSLGISGNKILTLGNLKFDTQDQDKINKGGSFTKSSLGLPDDSLVWICGSTHQGEEEIIVEVFSRLHLKFSNLHLVIAPRNIERSREIAALVSTTSFSFAFKSSINDKEEFQILILDTLGELATSYHIADIAFVGGSLVPQGGHNPIEAALAGIPVLFGHHMEDFSEIAADIISSGGARETASANELLVETDLLLSDSRKREFAGSRALEWVNSQKGVIDNHLQLLAPYLLHNKRT